MAGNFSYILHNYYVKQESPADVTVSARQRRYLANTFEVGHRSCDRRSNLCSHLAKALKLRKYLLLPQPTFV